MNKQNILFNAVVVILLAALFYPTWRWVGGEWLSNPYYSHGILVVAVTAYLLWRTSRRLPPPTPDNRALIALIGFGSLYLFFFNRHTFYLAAFVSVMVVACIIWLLWGFLTLRRVAFPLAFLWLAIPLPIVERATLPLSLWAGKASTTLVRWLGLDVAVNGAAVSLPNTTLTIGAQCSGINSIIALLTLTVLAAYLLRGPWWGKLALVASAVPLAMLGNVLRIANLLVVARFWGIAAAFNFYHNYAGGIFFVMVILLMYPLSKALQCKTLRWDVL